MIKLGIFNKIIIKDFIHLNTVLFLIFLSLLLSSCNSVKNLGISKTYSENRRQNQINTNSMNSNIEIRFNKKDTQTDNYFFSSQTSLINQSEEKKSNIEIQDKIINKKTPPSTSIYKKTAKIKINYSDTIRFTTNSYLCKKYSYIYGADIVAQIDEKLLHFIDQWIGTDYKIGGKDKRGIDCSSLICEAMGEIYNRQISGSSRKLFNLCKKIEKDNLKIGDLVFFTYNKHIGHVGLYIGQNKFFHSSSIFGVTISDLDDFYWKKRFVGAGRILNLNEPELTAN